MSAEVWELALVQLSVVEQRYRVVVAVVGGAAVSDVAAEAWVCRQSVYSWLAAQPLPEAACEQVTVALAMIDGIEVQIAPLDRELRAYAHRQAGCTALMAHCGIGPLVAVTILAELGDCTGFSSSRLALRYAGLDITVYQSDQRRAPGHLSRQGPPALRWALFEAAQSACRRGSPD